MMAQKPTLKKTHGQIIAALKAQARRTGEPPNDLYNRFFREVFLYHLMSREDGWVLKGGTNIYCLIPGARHTKDLDLYRRYDPTSAESAVDSLVTSMNGLRAGSYTFKLEKPERPQATGTVDSRRVNVEVLQGARPRAFVRFSIDVSGDLQVTGEVQKIEVTPSFDFNTDLIPSTYDVSSYPVPSQIADKVCAMYEMHGDQPPGIPSTRYHDLYDVARLARELSMSSAELRQALDTQKRVRNMALPERITLPHENWRTRYPAAAKHFPDTSTGWGLDDLDEALRIVGLLIDPVLKGESVYNDARWDPDNLTWT